MNDQKHFLLAHSYKYIKQLNKNFKVPLSQTEIGKQQVWYVNLKLGRSQFFLFTYHSMYLYL